MAESSAAALACLAALAACQPAPRAAPAVDRQAVARQLDSLVRSYGATLSSRDSARALSYYAPGLDLLGYNDGQAYSSDGTFAGIKGFIRVTRSIAIRFDTVAARAITNDVGVIWTGMTESWVDTTGGKGMINVFVSWVAERRDGRWQFVYYDGRHVALPAPARK